MSKVDKGESGAESVPTWEAAVRARHAAEDVELGAPLESVKIDPALVGPGRAMRARLPDDTIYDTMERAAARRGTAQKEALAEMERLRFAVLKYGQHTEHCNYVSGAGACSCGFNHAHYPGGVYPARPDGAPVTEPKEYE